VHTRVPATSRATERGVCPVCPSGAATTVVGTAPDFEYRTTGVDEWQIVECVCGTRLLDPCPADSEIASLYPPDYEPYQFHTMSMLVRLARGFVQRRKVESVRSVAGNGAVIIDLGCGSGALLAHLQDRGDPTWRLIGWDLPGPHLDRLRQTGIEVIAAPIGPVDDVVADVVILNQVIEHFRDPGAIIDLCESILRPGGHVIIETPATDGMDARLFRSRHWGGYHVPRHLVLFNHRSLAKLVESRAFRVVRAEALASPAFWVQSLHHWLTERRHGHAFARFFVVRNPLALALATIPDVVSSRYGRTSNQRLIARRLPSEPR
jgi:2-polyprenyl-3-methyl-5-hydroxy-6-metoxy-1,4-benzoquinol methylase